MNLYKNCYKNLPKMLNGSNRKVRPLQLEIKRNSVRTCEEMFLNTLKSIYFLMNILLLHSLFIEESLAGCVCNEEGSDQCLKCSETEVIRPQPVQHDIDVAKVNPPPVGDNCWCNKLRVAPVFQPKLCPKHKTTTCTCRDSTSETIFTNTEPNTYPSYMSPISTSFSAYDDSPAADPISISLAAEARKSIHVPEAKLSFGFVKKPIDERPKIQHSTVNEERLYAFNKDVITLPKQSHNLRHYGYNYDDIYYDEDGVDETPPDFNADKVNTRLTYKQLGYTPERSVNLKFKAVSRSSDNLQEDCDHGSNHESPSLTKRQQPSFYIKNQMETLPYISEIYY